MQFRRLPAGHCISLTRKSVCNDGAAPAVAGAKHQTLALTVGALQLGGNSRMVGIWNGAELFNVDVTVYNYRLYI